MASIVTRRSRVEWGPAITGAFCAAAAGIVLALFGAAFAEGGLRVLSGVWGVVTPLVAVFIGAAIAAAMTDRPDAYPTGIMVWCISLVTGALLLADVNASRALSGAQGLTSHAGLLALAGLAAILGFVGALLGSSVGAFAFGEPMSAGAAKATGDRPLEGTTADTRSVPRSPPAVSEQQLRH